MARVEPLAEIDDYIFSILQGDYETWKEIIEIAATGVNSLVEK